MTDAAHGVARDQLRAFIERIERLSEEAKTIADDIRDVKSQAKAMGFSVKAINEIIKLRKKDDQERMEEGLILDTYLAALGMIEAPFEQDDEPVAAAPTRSPAKPLQAPRTATTVSARVAINQPEMAPQMQHLGSHLIGNPEPALAAANRPNGDDGMVRMARTEASAVTAGETATSCEYCDGTGDVHRIDGEWLGYCHCDDGQRLKGSPVSEIAPASHGEAEAPSVESVSPSTDEGGSDANTGECPDDQVAQPQYAATHQAGSPFSTSRPADHPILLLRPHCQHPGEEVCGGSGKNHCQKCLAAMREVETA